MGSGDPLTGATGGPGFEATVRIGSRTVPQQRIVEKLDEYMSRRDLVGAERHLLYWLDEATMLADKRGELMVRNELVGHYRKVGDRERALQHAAAALQLVDDLGFGETMSAGTTYTNVATAYNAFDENERALRLFEKAARLYESSSATPARLIGGLYNNRALACVSLGRFDEADALFARALETMDAVENGELEQAITYLNMADAAVARARAACVSDGRTQDAVVDALDVELLVDGACADEVERLLDTAYALLNAPSVPRDGYYAFVCEKCAPTFAHYGYFLADADLRERARAIYERA